MRTKLINLHNSFHNTEVFLRAKVCESYLLLSKDQAKKAKKTLCPFSDCQCSDSSGIRMKKMIHEINQDGSFCLQQIED